MRQESYTNDTSATLVKSFDFHNKASENIFLHPILAMWQMKDYKKRNNIKNYLLEMPCSYAKNALEMCTSKIELYNRKAQSYIKKL